MNRRGWALLGAGWLALAAFSCTRQRAHQGVSPTAILVDLGPRLLSNQTPQPLAIYGEHFSPGIRLRLGPPFSRDFPLAVLDARHAYARLSALELPAPVSQALVSVWLVSAAGQALSGEGKLTLINDASFPDLTAMASSSDGRFLFVLSPTTDTAYVLDSSSGRAVALPAGDGPSALAAWSDASGKQWMAIAHAYVPELTLVRTDGVAGEALFQAKGSIERRSVSAPPYATGLVIDAGSGVAFVAEHARDSVVALSLAEGGGQLWRSAVDPNPRAMALVDFSEDSAGGSLAVGSLQTGALQFLSTRTGALQASAAPTPSMSIAGGRTAGHAKFIMGGKAPRALAYSRRFKRLFASSIGPNIGPNPDRMEVSMNGGVSTVAGPSPHFTLHLGLGAGIPEGLALDEVGGLLYVADIGLGKVRVLNAGKLSGPLASAGSALLQELPIPPPDTFPLVRPLSDFGAEGRAGVEIHSGPRQLVLSPDRSTLFVLNRFSGTVAVLDVRRAKSGGAVLVKQWRVEETLAQRGRRLGQILFYADLGRTGMSCDACHLEGHTEGVFFEKTRPIRIYRSPTLRGVRETPPYFIPTSTWSLAQTAEEVGGRNRFHNPNLTGEEVDYLTTFTAAIAPLPNPFLGADGAPLERLLLPDAGERWGNPRRGLELFEGTAGCSECHPAPHFTTDQSAQTRGRMTDVGTPRGLPLRPEMQELIVSAFPPPSLIGAWDIFPMLTSGAAGLRVMPDNTVGVATRFPLRAAVIDWATGPKPHGRAAALSAPEQDDLLSYVLSL